MGINGKTDRPAMIFYNENRGVSYIDCGQFRYMTIEEMQEIIDHCKGYIRAHKTNERIAQMNEKMWESQRKSEKEEENKMWAERRLNKKIKADPKCHVYLVKDALRGVHKVGITGNVKTRFKQIKTYNPGTELIAHYYGKQSDEGIIHGVLHSFGKHVDGEWFNMDAADIDYFHKYFSTDTPF